jgi:hypothetical protein
MSIATVNIPTAGQPPVVSLPTGHRACRSCGVAVAAADGDVVRLSIGSHWEPMPGGGAASQRAVTDWLEVATCERCAVIRSEAARVVDEHRVLQRDLGGVAFERVEGALLALNVLGSPLPELRSAAEVLKLVSLVHGAGVAFEALQRPGVCASSRWAHVGGELRQALRDAVGRWMHARLAKPAEPLGPPADSPLRACAYCGVDRHDVWEAVTVSTRALGGAPTPGYLEADLCGACADAVVAVGSVGRSSMVRALFAHLGIPRRNVDEIVEVHVVGFGALPAGTRPNTAPWQHVDASALREDLRSVGVA